MSRRSNVTTSGDCVLKIGGGGVVEIDRVTASTILYRFTQAVTREFITQLARAVAPGVYTRNVKSRYGWKSSSDREREGRTQKQRVVVAVVVIVVVVVVVLVVVYLQKDQTGPNQR